MVYHSSLQSIANGSVQVTVRKRTVLHLMRLHTVSGLLRQLVSHTVPFRRAEDPWSRS